MADILDSFRCWLILHSKWSERRMWNKELRNLWSNLNWDGED